LRKRNKFRKDKKFAKIVKLKRFDFFQAYCRLNLKIFKVNQSFWGKKRLLCGKKINPKLLNNEFRIFYQGMTDNFKSF